ncbi:helix-turn-helix domain-containing protein [Bacillus zanthoxyli]|nr:helix-turn-helix domain-containing protein [Bacillus zanthoxyli]
MKWVNNIDAYIIKSGRSRKFIAKQLGISENQFLAWRKGEYLPPVDKAILLAELLDCTVYDLFEKENEDKNKNESQK